MPAARGLSMPAPVPHAAWRPIALERAGGLRVRLADLGATWMSCEVPLAGGLRREVLLAGDGPDADTRPVGAYLGATIGRWANRIRDARVTIDGRTVALVANENGHQLHGGPRGFDRCLWRLRQHDSAEAVFGLESPAGDQGFPGDVRAQVAYRIATDGLTMEIDFDADVGAPTPLAMTNHAYLNLDGPAQDVRGHWLRIAASHYVPVDAEWIPSADPQPVAGSEFDFRAGRVIAAGRGGDYDHAFVLEAAVRAGDAPAAELRSADGRLRALLFTDQPALQLYTGARLAGTPARGGQAYPAFAGLALEPGLPPDAPNRPHWPAAAGAIARPGRPWQARMRWEFIPEGRQ